MGTRKTRKAKKNRRIRQKAGADTPDSSFNEGHTDRESISFDPDEPFHVDIEAIPMANEVHELEMGLLDDSFASDNLDESFGSIEFDDDTPNIDLSLGGKRKTRKSNKRFRKTRSKKQRGGGLYDIDFIRASMYGDTKIVEKLLNKGANVNAQNYNGNTALILASSNGRTEIVEMLLKHPKIDVNLNDASGYTALMWASNMGHTEIVVMLLEKGADVNANMELGWTALMMANQNGHTEIVNMLEQKMKAIEVANEIAENAARQNTIFNIPSLNQIAYANLTDEQRQEIARHSLNINENTGEIVPYYHGTRGGKRKSKRKTRKTRKNHRKKK